MQITISIHAPAWGATQGRQLVFRMLVISIHAPAWGATGGAWRVHQRHSDFNPRSRMGSDTAHGIQESQRAYFNPRSRMGSD